MNSFETILKRRSIRAYKETPVKDENIKTLLEAAMAAPSARNCQPWEFYVIKDAGINAKIKESIKSANYNAPLSIVVAANLDNTITHTEKDYCIQDCSSALTNLLNEAVELGLGTVWCGVYPNAERVGIINDVLQLPNNILPIALILVGYPDEEKEARTQYDEAKVHII